MSNKIVPAIYRAVIDDVISNIKPEFDEYGIGEDVLAELQHKWENKVIASHVAEFEAPPPPPPNPHPQHPPYPPHPMHAHSAHPPHTLHPTHYPPAHNPYATQTPHAHQPPGPQIKAEPVDNRYMLNGQGALPPFNLAGLPSPQVSGVRPTNGVQYASPVINRPPSNAPAPPPPTARYPPGSTVPQQRIPQVDGPSSSSSGSSSPPPSQGYAPRSSHPSLPQPSQSAGGSTKADDEEAINSDLDDSDSDNDVEGEEGGAADTDIVFCTYDKVARVKNKWKCILKDGMIHINGKDYLFAKCTGEFEW